MAVNLAVETHNRLILFSIFFVLGKQISKNFLVDWSLLAVGGLVANNSTDVAADPCLVRECRIANLGFQLLITLHLLNHLHVNPIIGRREVSEHRQAQILISDD